MSLPTAEDLFRPVEYSQDRTSDARQDQDEPESDEDGGLRGRRPSGRVRHD